MIIIYGVETFTKHMGFFGPVETCPNCSRSYSPAYVRSRTWFHLTYIPIFPVKTCYYKTCPVCGNSVELDKKTAKSLMINPNYSQSVCMYARHILSLKPAKLFDPDNSYELWFKDFITNQEFCVFAGLSKEQIKNIKKNMGLKQFQIIDYN
ncbi:MAG: zinc ribbon domain-containing protein [Bacilli bacterium]|nr:zinc ribbon domain-containing protein [Bacilli bacterium]